MKNLNYISKLYKTLNYNIIKKLFVKAFIIYNNINKDFEKNWKFNYKIKLYIKNLCNFKIIKKLWS